VDDNRDAAETLAQYLALMGHDVAVEFDGATALGAFERRRPEVVVMDIGMPGLNGYDVARRLRRLPGGDRVLLIAMTGYGQDEDRRRSREAGFDYHLTKPVDPAALQALLAAEADRDRAGWPEPLRAVEEDQTGRVSVDEVAAADGT
jgi:CheY-like chemotaxis protein